METSTLITTRHVETPSGRLGYHEQGTGRVALFVHGVLLNGHLWRQQHWLADTIPGTIRRVELPGGRIFFPEERSEEFNRELRAHWQAADDPRRR